MEMIRESVIVLRPTTEAVAVTTRVAVRAFGALVSRREGRCVGNVDCEVVADSEGGVVDTASSRERETGTLKGPAAYGTDIPPNSLCVCIY